MAYAFQTRIELECEEGFHPRVDLSTYHSKDFDLRLGDLHYRDVCEYAVGRNTSAGWTQMPEEGVRDPRRRRLRTSQGPVRPLHRTIGIAHAEAKLTLANIAYNMDRLTFHVRRMATR